MLGQTSTPAAATPASAIDKLSTLVQTPEAQAILALAEKRAAELINGLPSQQAVTLDAVTHLPVGTPGWKTSEFWCLVVFWLLSTLTMLAGALPPKWALLANAVTTGLYQISRGLTKHGTGN